MKKESPYGYCPTCGAAGFSRERGLAGYDICTNNHKYLTANALSNSKECLNNIYSHEEFVFLRRKVKEQRKALSHLNRHNSINMKLWMRSEDALAHRQALLSERNGEVMELTKKVKGLESQIVVMAKKYQDLVENLLRCNREPENDNGADANKEAPLGTVDPVP